MLVVARPASSWNWVIGSAARAGSDGGGSVFRRGAGRVGLVTGAGSERLTSLIGDGAGDAGSERLTSLIGGGAEGAGC